jgi:hypothetical protein
MYRVNKTIVSLAHGKEFAAGGRLYGNEFQDYAFAAMLADGTIEEIGAKPEVEEPLPEVEAVGPIMIGEAKAQDEPEQDEPALDEPDLDEPVSDEDEATEPEVEEPDDDAEPVDADADDGEPSDDEKPRKKGRKK